ncbi:MAG: carboxypeptidase regulatory-like domain-containing protein, partial [Bacillota bacterium]
MSSKKRRAGRVPGRRRAYLQQSTNWRRTPIGAELLEQRLLLASVAWIADSSGFWDDGNNWSTGSVPTAFDDVIIDRPGVSLTVTHRSGTDTVRSLTAGESLVLSGGTLTLTASAPMNVTDLMIGGGSTFTLSGGASLNASGSLLITGNSTLLVQSQNTDGQVDGQWAGVGGSIQAANVTIEAGSTINADAQGYRGGVDGDGYGPGGGPGNAGGTYGSAGGNASWGTAITTPYGNPFTPTEIGSGGGGYDGLGGGQGGAGGGAIRLTVSGTLQMDGAITANGQSMNTGRGEGGGSGGSIYVTAGTLLGSGRFQADGGSSMTGRGGGGSGGRLAVYYTLDGGFTGFATSSVQGGTGNSVGQPGTGAFFDLSSEHPALRVVSSFVLDTNAEYTYSSVTVIGSSLYVGGGTTLNVDGTLRVTAGSTLYALGANRTGQVDGTWRGVGVKINASRIEISADSRVNADGQGYTGGIYAASGSGPGGGVCDWAGNPSGGSYGGRGAASSDAPISDVTYGSAFEPVDLGSGGAGGTGDGIPGGSGGGAIDLHASTLVLDGVMSANGAAGEGGSGGGGSGGSIFVTTGALSGGGHFEAKGGDRNGIGGWSGGGGRILVRYQTSDSFSGSGTSTVAGGSGAGAGTLAFLDTSTANPGLSVYNSFVVDPGSQLTFSRIDIGPGTLTIGEGATLTSEGSINVVDAIIVIGGGSQIVAAGDFNITGHSTLTLQSKDRTTQVNGAWAGVGVELTAGRMTLGADSVITADGQGYAGGTPAKPGSGPGGGSAGNGLTGTGAGHGVAGGTTGPLAGGPTYGSAVTPVDLGSGGGGGYSGAGGGAGGGAITVHVAQDFTLDGIITASGANGVSWGDGGGSGGSVFITAGGIGGTGIIRANGGNQSGNCGNWGAGGRVAIQTSGIMTLPIANIHVDSDVTAGAGSAVVNDRYVGPQPSLTWECPPYASGQAFASWSALRADQVTTTVDVIASRNGESVSLVTGVPLSNGGCTWNWDIAPLADGVYDLDAVLRNGAGELIAHSTREVLVNNSVAWHSTPVTSDQTWTADRVHVIAGALAIAAGVHVTIAPGTVVKLGKDASIQVQANSVLEALGASGSPIIFTYLSDDSAGGDTNLDGSVSQPVPGDCNGVIVTGGQFLITPFVETRYIGTTHSGTLTGSEVWASGTVHHVTGDIVVPAGLNLIIQPGAIVKFDRNAAIDVSGVNGAIPSGQILAEGSAGLPIIFTSVADDTAGGDTNGDGDATSPAAGDWGGLHIIGRGTLNQVQVLYAGGYHPYIGEWSYSAVAAKGSLVISNSIIRSSWYLGIGIDSSPATRADICNTTITDCRVGFSAAYVSSARLVNCTLDHNAVGIDIPYQSSVEIVNTIVSNSRDIGLKAPVAAGDTPLILISNNIWSATGKNYDQIVDQTGLNGNLSVDPRFADAETGNYRLQYGSLMIDAGDGSFAPQTDASGFPRYDDPRATNTGTPIPGTTLPPDIGAFEFVRTTAADSDLLVESVEGSQALTAGQTVTVRWRETNSGSATLSGTWHDRIQLVADSPSRGQTILIAGEPQVSKVLDPGESADFEASVTVPGGTEGMWRWQIVANCRGEVFENQVNNNGPLSAPVILHVPDLSLGTPLESAYRTPAAPVWIKFLQPAATQVLVTLQSNAATGRTRLYVGFDSMPTSQDFDLQSIEWTASVAMAIPASVDRSRTVYLFAVPESFSQADLGFVLTARSANLELDSLGLAMAGNTSRATIPLIGSGFSSGMSVRLNRGDTSLLAQSVQVSDSAHAMAEFDLHDAAPDLYSVAIEQDGQTRQLDDAFTITAGQGGRLEARLIMPTGVRVGRRFRSSIEISNTGDADLAVPLLILQADSQSTVWGDGSDSPAGSLMVLGLPPGELAGSVIRPGQRFSIPLNASTQSDFPEFILLSKSGDSTDTIDWDSMLQLLRPANPHPLWDAAWAAVRSRIGSSVAEYSAALVQASNEMYSYGVGSRLVTDILGYMIRREMTFMGPANVRGKLRLDGTGQPLAMTTLTLRNRDTSQTFLSQSWYDGSFSIFKVPAGTYDVSVQGYLPAVWGQVTVPASGSLIGLDITVQNSRRITGRVLDADYRAGVSATVSASPVNSLSADAFYVTQADGEGYFTLAGLPDGVYRLTVQSQGFVSPDPQLIACSSQDAGGLLYVLERGGAVNGHILSPSGIALANASVMLMGTDSPYTASAVTDTTGSYSVSGLVPGTYKLIATADGYGSASITGLVVEADKATACPDVKLSNYGVVQGTVTDAATGLPIAGAAIHGTPSELGSFLGSKLITNNSGEFTIGHVTPGAQEIWATKDGYLPDFATMTVGAGESSSVSISLRPAGRIAGQVVRNGVAVAGQPLLLIDSDEKIISVQADAAGHFSFVNLADGMYSLYVGSDPRIAAPYQQYTLTPSANRYDVTVPLHYSVLSGMVYVPGSSTPAIGTPVELEQEGRVIATSQTDASGQYQFTLFQGGTFDLFSTPGNRIAASRDVQVTLDEDRTGLDLVCGSSLLNLTVGSSAAGFPLLADASVWLTPANAAIDSRIQLAATTDQNGQVEFSNIPADTYRIVVSSAGYATWTQTVEAGATIAVDLAQECTLAGVVTDSEGQGLKAYLRLSDASGRTWIGEAADDGTYSISSLPTGIVDVWVYDGTHSLAHVTNLDLSSPANRTLNVSLAADGATLVGTVSNGDGLSVAGAAVNIVDAGQHVLISAYTDQTGRYVLGPLPAGALSVRTELFGLPPLITDFTVPDSQGSYTLDLALESQVVDPAVWRQLPQLPATASGGELILMSQGAHPAPLPPAPAPSQAANPSQGPIAAEGDSSDFFSDIVTGTFGIPFPTPFEFLGGQHDFATPPTRWCQAWQDAYDAAEKSSDQVNRLWKQAMEDYDLLQSRNLNEIKYALAQAGAIGTKAVQSLSGLTGHFGNLTNPPAIPTLRWDQLASNMRRTGEMNSVKGMLQEAIQIPGLSNWASRQLAAMQGPDGMGGKVLADLVVNFGKNGIDLATGLAAAYRADLRGKALSDAQEVVAIKWTQKFATTIMDAAYKSAFDFPILGDLLSVRNTVNDFVRFNEEMKTAFQDRVLSAMLDYSSTLDLYGRAATTHAENQKNVRAAAEYCRAPNDTDPQKPLPSLPKPDPRDTRRPNGVRPRDPNDMLTIGYGPENWVRADSTIYYTIDFENVPTATAAAQEVVVTNRLSADLDWSTFQLDQIAFNHVTIAVPPGLQSYHTQVHVASDPNPVRIDATFNADMGLVTWRLMSIDAIAGQLTEDPLAGFLPPDDAEGSGQGLVTYTCRPKAALANGTQIANHATIVFDVNEPIDTNTVINTVDATVPQGTVAAWTANATDTTFVVSWAGADAAGSGIAGYDIYVSDNGAPFSSWLTGTQATSAPFTGQDGHSYAFYAVATDNVGQRQSFPAEAQSTAIIPVATVTAKLSGPVAALRGQTLSFSLGASDTLAARQ